MIYRRIIVVFVGALCICASLPSVHAAPPDSITTTLHYQDNGFSLPLALRLNRGVNFSKEPEYDTKDVITTVIPLSDHDASQFIGLAMTKMSTPYDRRGRAKGHTLYIDHNRNLDLTDDPDNKFVGSTIGVYKTFQNVTVEVERDNLIFPYCFDLAYTFQVRSGWAGTLKVGERFFRIGIADNFDGVINIQDQLYLVEATSSEDQPIFPKENMDFVTEYLFVEGALYTLEFEWQPQDSGVPVLQVTLQRQQDDLVTAKIDGEKIEHLHLGGKKEITCWGPLDLLHLPKDNYKLRSLRLEGGYVMASPTQYLNTQKEGAVLTVGAPLKSTLRVNRSGRSFSLRYKLLGKGGMEYVDQSELQRQPRWEVYQGDTLLASGKFEYG